MSHSLDHLLWRNTLGKAPAVPDAMELDAWSSYFDPADAAVLRDCAALQRGFSPEARRAISRAERSPMPGKSGPHTAMDELRALSRGLSFPPRLSEPGLSFVSKDRLGTPAAASFAGPNPSIDLAGAAREMVAVLDQPDSPDLDRLVRIMRELAVAGRRRPATDYRWYATAAMPLLASAIAATCLFDFALRLRDLVEKPLGSPMLLHRAARFSSGGLGPYFGNVGHLARNSRDVFDLARIAAGVDDDAEAVGPWIVLLSRRCEGPLLQEIVDDLGDYAAYAPLSAILDRTISLLPPQVDIPMVARVRDAALDNGNAALAARAQTAMTRFRPDDILEQEILGDICATGGNLVDALAAYRTCLRIDPGHQGVRARLETLGTAEFAPFLIVRGFGSPPDRAEARLYRRGVMLPYARRAGAVIRAVDVA